MKNYLVKTSFTAFSLLFSTAANTWGMQPCTQNDTYYRLSYRAGRDYWAFQKYLPNAVEIIVHEDAVPSKMEKDLTIKETHFFLFNTKFSQQKDYQCINSEDEHNKQTIKTLLSSTDEENLPIVSKEELQGKHQQVITPKGLQNFDDLPDPNELFGGSDDDDNNYDDSGDYSNNNTRSNGTQSQEPLKTPDPETTTEKNPKETPQPPTSGDNTPPEIQKSETPKQTPEPPKPHTQPQNNKPKNPKTNLSTKDQGGKKKNISGSDDQKLPDPVNDEDNLLPKLLGVIGIIILIYIGYRAKTKPSSKKKEDVKE